MPTPISRPDEAHAVTDVLLSDLEARLKTEYEQASREVKEKLDDYMRRFRTKDKIKRKQYLAGEITRKEYYEWRKGQIMMGRRWQDMRDTLAADLHNANTIARSIIDGYMPEVYALNHNYATFEIERQSLIDTSYSLYNREAVERIMRDDPDLLPPPGKRVKAAVAAGKDVLWNKQVVQSVMLQGILQGESIPELAKRVSRTLGNRNLSSSIRYARTAMTEAENAGRYNAYRCATRMGIPLTIEWLATLDNRTRHNHRMLHGQRREVDEPFRVTEGKETIEILYPAASMSRPGQRSDVPQHMIWNCRCSLVAWVKGVERETVRTSPKLGNMSYEEWLNAKPVYNPIKLPMEKAEAIRRAHIANYRRAAARL